MNISKEELNRILENHQHWLNRDCDGWSEMRANLEEANLRGANLRGADLRGANLEEANLEGANLRGADLWGANLEGANLRGADLEGANLRGANLRGANLRGANLRGADLWGADLWGANLEGANLEGANLEGANLRGANLRGADLRGANLEEAEGAFIPLACPSHGSFTAFKKADGKIVELRIPADARRTSATTEKCRCDKAEVIAIYDLHHNKLEIDSVESDRGNLVYEVGETVYPDAFDENRWIECTNGIHFFIDFEMAVRY